MKNEIFKRMLTAATGAMNHSHSPYSGFRVGAAVLGGSGEVYAGCNVENASFPVSLCAERGALAAWPPTASSYKPDGATDRVGP